MGARLSHVLRAIATHIGDVSGRGEPDLLLEETWEESETISHVLSVAGRAGGILGDGLY